MLNIQYKRVNVHPSVELIFILSVWQDKWTCGHCEFVNRPLRRFCDKCWSLRPGWLREGPTCKTASKDPTCSSSLTRHKRSASLDTLPASDIDVEDIKQLDRDSGIGGSFCDLIKSPRKNYEEQSNASVSTCPTGSTSASNQLDRDLGIGGSFCNSMKSPRKTYEEESNASVSTCPAGTTATSNQVDHDSGISRSFCDSMKSPRKTYEEQLNSSVSTCPAATTAASNQNLCIVCMVKPKEASVIHGKTGHQVCCYPCAKKLKRKGKPCPVCRRPIQKVIKNFIV